MTSILTSKAGVLTVLYTEYVTGNSAKKTHKHHIASILESDGVGPGKKLTCVDSLVSAAELMGMDVSDGFSRMAACGEGHILSAKSNLV